jgi:ribonuclease P protein component
MRFLPAQHLTRQSDIRAVRESGRRLDCRAFTLWWKPRETQPNIGPRVCVIASTHAVGHAVLRNRAKRRLREVFRHHQTHLPASCDFLLIARAATTTWPISELEKRFVDACRQIPARAPAPAVFVSLPSAAKPVVIPTPPAAIP